MRTEFSGKTKVKAFVRSCGRCEECKRYLMAGDINYDHEIPAELGGFPTLENCRVLCRSCHVIKTSSQDIPRIAKAKRNYRRNAGIRKPRTITRWRNFKGEIVVRPRER